MVTGTEVREPDGPRGNPHISPADNSEIELMVWSGVSESLLGTCFRENPCKIRIVRQSFALAGAISLSSRSPTITAFPGAHWARERACANILGSGLESPASAEETMTENTSWIPSFLR